MTYPDPATSTARPTAAHPERMPVLQRTVLAAALFAAVLTEVMPVGLLPLLAETFAVDVQRLPRRA